VGGYVVGWLEWDRVLFSCWEDDVVETNITREGCTVEPGEMWCSPW